MLFYFVSYAGYYPAFFSVYAPRIHARHFSPFISPAFDAGIRRSLCGLLFRSHFHVMAHFVFHLL